MTNAEKENTIQQENLKKGARDGPLPIKVSVDSPKRAVLFLLTCSVAV